MRTKDTGIGEVFESSRYLGVVSFLTLALLYFCLVDCQPGRSTKSIIWSEVDGASASLVFVHGDPVDWVPTHSAVTRPRLIGTGGPPWPLNSSISLSFDYDGNALFWSDPLEKSIIGLKLDDDLERPYVIYTGTSTEVFGVAFDWVGRNIYWTDSVYGWIMMLAVTSTTSVGQQESYSSVVVSELTRPAGIVLYPSKGLMMWSNWGKDPKIEMTSLSGQRRQVLVATGLSRPFGMAIDFKSDRLFWIDSDRGVIGSINLFGHNNRRLHVHMVGATFHGIAVNEDYMLVTETTNRRLFAFNKTTSRLDVSFSVGAGTPLDLVIYDANPQESFLCRTAGCNHLCVTNHHRSIVCMCASGFELRPDGKTCKESFRSNFIVLFGDGKVSRLQYEGVGHPFPIYLPEGDFPVAIDYDEFGHKLYWIDGRAKVAKRSNLNGTDVQILRSLPEDSAVSGLAVDSISGLFFYTDSGRRLIGVMTLQGAYHATILQNNLDRPSAIVLDPVKGLMFWTELGRRSGIERADMDGTGRRWIISVDNKSVPSGLAIDTVEQKVYWCDGAEGAIEVSDYDGMRRRVIYWERSSTIHGLSLSPDGHLFYLDKTKRTLMKLVKKRKSVYVSAASRPLPRSFDVSDFRAYVHHNRSDDDMTKQTIIDGRFNQCSFWNGGCSYFCFPVRNGRHCMCPDGMTIHPSGQCTEGQVSKEAGSSILVSGLQQRSLPYNSTLLYASDFHPPGVPGSSGTQSVSSRLSVATKLVENTSVDCLRSSDSISTAIKSEFSEINTSSTSQTQDPCRSLVATSDTNTLPQDVLTEQTPSSDSQTTRPTKPASGYPVSPGHAGVFTILDKNTNLPHFTVLTAKRRDVDAPLHISPKPLTFDWKSFSDDNIHSFSQQQITSPGTSAEQVENWSVYLSDLPGRLTLDSTTTPSAITENDIVVTSTKVRLLTPVLKGTLTLNEKLQNTESLQGTLTLNEKLQNTESLQGKRQTSKTLEITESTNAVGGNTKHSTEYEDLFVPAHHSKVIDSNDKQGSKQSDSLSNTESDTFKAERSDKDALFQSKDGYESTSLYATATARDGFEMNTMRPQGAPGKLTTGTRHPTTESTELYQLASARTLGIEVPGMKNTSGEIHPFDDNRTQSHNITQRKVENVTDETNKGIGVGIFSLVNVIATVTAAIVFLALVAIVALLLRHKICCRRNSPRDLATSDSDSPVCSSGEQATNHPPANVGKRSVSLGERFQIENFCPDEDSKDTYCDHGRQQTFSTFLENDMASEEISYMQSTCEDNSRKENATFSRSMPICNEWHTACEGISCLHPLCEATCTSHDKPAYLDKYALPSCTEVKCRHSASEHISDRQPHCVGTSHKQSTC